MQFRRGKVCINIAQTECGAGCGRMRAKIKMRGCGEETTKATADHLTRWARRTSARTTAGNHAVPAMMDSVDCSNCDTSTTMTTRTGQTLAPLAMQPVVL